MRGWLTLVLTTLCLAVVYLAYRLAAVYTKDLGNFVVFMPALQGGLGVWARLLQLGYSQGEVARQHTDSVNLPPPNNAR
jgi:hypothetical protein